MKHPTVIFFYFFYIHYLIKSICVNTHRGTDIMNLFYLFFSDCRTERFQIEKCRHRDVWLIHLPHLRVPGRNGDHQEHSEMGG